MSDDEREFWFTLPKHDAYPPFPGSFEEGERLFLQQLEETGSLDAVNCLIQHYRLHRREDLARPKLEQLIATAAHLEARALFYVYLGQSYERTAEWEAAIECYRDAAALEPCGAFAAYYAHNNLAYCLSVLGRHAEAEPLCRLAIRIAPARPNAHKNLGLSLQGQGDFAGAARAWVAATRANRCDSRSLVLLERLVEVRPQLLDEVPGLGDELDECRRAVAGMLRLYRAAKNGEPDPGEDEPGGGGLERSV